MTTSLTWPDALPGFDESLVRWNASSEKHGIDEEKARFLVTYPMGVDERLKRGFPDPLGMYWGRGPRPSEDEAGLPLEVGVVQRWPNGVAPVGDPEYFEIIHAMRAREYWEKKIQLREQKRF